MSLDLVIGGCIGYTIADLRPWVLSVCETMPKADKVMCVANISHETRVWLTEHGFTLIETPVPENIAPHVIRFYSIYEYLKTNYTKYRYVLTTDVRDVFFQHDPFAWVDNNIGSRKIVIGSEGLLYRDESWGDENLRSAYPICYPDFKHNEIYNVGMLCGLSEYIKDLTFNIFIHSTNRPIQICDQATFNVIIQTQPYKDIILYTKQYDGLVCHAGTTADPIKINRFRPNLLEKEPTFKDNLIRTHNGIPFAIVHQYDRIPTWNQYVRSRYNNG